MVHLIIDCWASSDDDSGVIDVHLCVNLFIIFNILADRSMGLVLK